MLRLAAIPALMMAMAAPAQAAPMCKADAVETRHHAVIGGRRIDYAACAGTLPVRNLKGEVRGRIFYTAYIVQGRKPRPLTFIWNGGPGADSRLLHFHALGPRVIAGGRLTDNPASPLAVSDLVFVDPVGTGFSRADTPDHSADFYGTRADIASVAGFVSDWRTTYKRTDAPLYLAGESFGTWRAAGVAEALVDAGTPVAGIALISGGIPLGDMPDRNLMRALSLDSRIATAHALGRLAPNTDRAKMLAEARQWGTQVYAPALAAPDALSPEQRAAVIAALARYQGMDPAIVDGKTLWVSPRQFRTALLANEKKVLDIFDMRRSGPEPDEAAENALALDYYRTTLGYREGSYAGIDAPAPDAGAKWQYDQSPITKESLARAMAGEGPPSPSQPWTLRAMEKAPKLRTWVAAGRFDSLNSCAGNEATVAALPKSVAARFVLRCYEGGHMMYEDDRETLRFGREFSAFLKRGA
ncbi:S10 family serine carboxypeptidase-like protein [Novosphingobium kaempferiae]|uniref:S10 family serine carboxypeptidase-like protein n=1 Tax=Novosphingobium kaempferiae TaxID=2896849 RepID=UPI001E33DB6E|nr:peptidase S10 [Novosphingobium kaempferiae]